MLRDQAWKTVYRTGEDDLLNDFYLPALLCAKNYDRAVGFFSSELLVSAAAGLSSLIKNDGKFRLIIGHPLDEDEYLSVQEGKRESWLHDIGEQLLKMLAADKGHLHNYRLNILTWLVACGRLEFKFAFRKSGMYHEKIGIVRDQDGNKLVFQGSANETLYAMSPQFNSESISVYPSWTDAYSNYGKYYEDAFEKIWSGTHADIYTLDLPSEIYEKIAASSSRPDLDIEGDLADSSAKLDLFEMIQSEPRIPKVLNGERFVIKEHQRNALIAWKANHYQGILKLATGAGKTITSIYGAVKLYEGNGRRLCMVIAVPYVELALQWVNVLRIFNIYALTCFDKQSVWYGRLAEEVKTLSTRENFFLPIVVVNKTMQSPEFQSLIRDIPFSNLLMIGDECHRHGTESLSSSLPDAQYRIGLSATPFNDDDEEFDSPFPNMNKQRIIGYYGEIVADYSLGQAINDDVLTPYNYHVHPVYLTEEEQTLLDEISQKIANALSGFESSSSASANFTVLCGQRSRLLGAAHEKFVKLNSLMKHDNGKTKGHCLFYCAEGSSTENGIDVKNVDRVSSILNENGWKVSPFTSLESSTTRKSIMESFLDGGIDGLIAMKVLDEGVDIPACRSAYILASTRNPRQYVQRRGRILRKAKGKIFAVIHDFFIMPFPGSKTSASANLINSELERIRDFAALAQNKSEINETLKKIGAI